jgi:hypothetical protein
MICSTALLIGAVILIALGAEMASNKQSSSSNLNQNPPGDPTEPPVLVMVSDAPNPNPTSSPGFPSPQFPDKATPSPTVGVTPGTSQESTPASTPVSSTNNLPNGTGPSGSSVINFFAMGGRFDGDALFALTDELKSLPNIDGNTVLFHLGDWNSPYATSCDESSYTQNVEVYQQSSIPVYFVPGDNEFNGRSFVSENGRARI